jgi:hypothetical protein
MILVAVDPALRCSGLALFNDGVLVYAASVKSPSGPGADIGARALAMASVLAERVQLLHPRTSYQVAIEWPQVYRGPHAKGDPNDLPALAAVGAAVAALVRASSLRSFTPRDWAGQIPKATRGDCKASPRARRIRSRLSDLEASVWDALNPSDHDAVDAIGIGCHALGRGLVRPAVGTTGLPSSRRA